MAEGNSRPAKGEGWVHDCRCAAKLDWLVGVDEVGRGAFAGPIVAAAVAAKKTYFDSDPWGEGRAHIVDSKKLSSARREMVFEGLHARDWQQQLIFATGTAEVGEIDRHNVVGATCLAMNRAVAALSERGLPPLEFGPDELFHSQARVRVLVDGPRMRALSFPCENLIRGDNRSHLIALASIIAKVYRDRLMCRLAAAFPHFQWERNKGYGTRSHCDAILMAGRSPHHRAAFLRKLTGNLNSD